ncbi:DNA internalization-related competence protein ComEC/Rec2 [Apilactobacillus apisilvae]|uniref:DNA internalization-related competence protein ComEC/Rec2 n=1 Tax=Apilactobacillus apisilvae TaxID=2923364 RepID=A0ABY4PID0_9LACO|nr:DNA internalization-related competence protein ComEC/Rec2 [Apilactobacillus apisilvae]UQS85514.1 DNA internalization-related competence protein ComEC/Rec2 [Apilactobacillus apisilvae]
MELLIHPDELKIKDDSYSGVCKSKDNKKYIFYSNQDINYIKHLHSAVNLTVNCKISPIHLPTNENEFNMKEYYQSNDIYESIYVSKITKIEAVNRISIIDKLHNFRQKLIEYGNALPKPLNLYFNSLFLGKMDDSFNDELSGVKTLGLIHLFSISGLHVFYIIGVLTFLFINCKISREKYLLLLIIILPIFFILAGSSIGLLRSIISVEISMVLALFKRKISSLDIWSLSIIINLFLQPQMLIQFGCQLSYVLAFGLVYTKNLNTYFQTIFMNLISLPLIIYRIFEWHLLTMLANFIVIPIFSIIIMPLITISILTYPLIPFFSDITATILSYFDNILNFIGKLPGNITFGKPNVFVCLILLIMTLFLIANYSNKKMIILLIAYICSYVFIHFPISGEVTTFDVGQGDSFLIREPFNKSITMIDTGGKVQFGKTSSSPKYKAPKISINYLKSHGLNYIDNLVLTHQDADHTGDVPSILNNLYVKRIIIGEGTKDNKNFMDKILPNLKSTKLIFVSANSKIFNFPFEIYHPFKPGLGNNEDSIVLGTRKGNLNWLFMGDLGQNGEIDIINKYPNLTADVLKLGHHGSKNSSSDKFLDFIHPKVAIISAGRNNRYHHPNNEVLDKLYKRQITYFNTQKQGMISYKYGFLGNYWKTFLKENDLED